ncbi:MULTISPECIES: hypothetical protein [unclassified Streptomyces]|uniref:hypothetical protein n=1 Tax=unclassified Streptomyces TaxID=2593676 RepID=UPI00203616C0|nr:MULTISPECIES: hypothetical protein [unclassified Streptomyces]
MALLVCALAGVAVGALCSRPVVNSPGYAVTAAGLGSLLALVTAGSPARVVVTGLVGGSVRVPLGAPAGAVALSAVAGAVACLVSARRG